MGQQQLLLVILVTIIVGVATVVALNVFGSSAKNANRDAVRQDILTIGSEAQGWYMKPSLMGGGGDSFVNVNFDTLGFGYNKKETTAKGGNSTDVYNANGEYQLQTATADSVEVIATPAQSKNTPIHAWISQGNVYIPKK